MTHAVRKVGRAVAHAAKTVACKATSMVRAGVKATSRAAKNIVNTANEKQM